MGANGREYFSLNAFTATWWTFSELSLWCNFLGRFQYDALLALPRHISGPRCLAISNQYHIGLLSYWCGYVGILCCAKHDVKMTMKFCHDKMVYVL